MRILHIINHIKKIGNGIVNVAVDLACLQAKNGHEVAMASAGGEYIELLTNYGIKHFNLDQSRTPLTIIKATLSYREVIETFQPDVVHAHMMTGVLLAKLLKNSYQYSLVSTVHNEFQRSSVLMGLADRVIAVSNAVANSMIKRGIPPEKLRVVANGILSSPRHQNIAEYQPLKLHHPAITTVAGMYKRKGIIELIEAFEKVAHQFPQAHLYLVGDGPDKPIFENIAKHTNCADRIHFEGFQPEPQRYMLETDIFVLASHCESFGLVLTEAREAGCAIVASNVDGIPETLDNCQAGLLIPPKNSYILAKTLTQLLSDPEYINEWKHRAQQNLERFNINRVHQETLAVYYELTRKYEVFNHVKPQKIMQVVNQNK